MNTACHLAAQGWGVGAGQGQPLFYSSSRHGIRGGQTGGVQCFTCSALGCHLASSLLLRILGLVRFVQAFIGNLAVSARVSVFCITYSAAFLAPRSEPGRAGSTQCGGRREAATEVEPRRSWFIYGGQMLKARCAGLHPCLELQQSLPCQSARPTTAWPGALKRGLVASSLLSLP